MKSILIGATALLVAVLVINLVMGPSNVGTRPDEHPVVEALQIFEVATLSVSWRGMALIERGGPLVPLIGLEVGAAAILVEYAVQARLGVAGMPVPSVGNRVITFRMDDLNIEVLSPEISDIRVTRQFSTGLNFQTVSAATAINAVNVMRSRVIEDLLTPSRKADARDNFIEQITRFLNAVAPMYNVVWL